MRANVRGSLVVEPVKTSQSKQGDRRRSIGQGVWRFVEAEMVEDLLDGVGVLNTSDGLHFAAAFGAFLYVYGEDAFQALGPGHGVGFGLAGLFGLFGVIGNDLGSEFAVGSEYAVEAGKIDAGLGDEGGESADEFLWGEYDVGGAVVIRCLEVIDDIAVGGEGEALFGDGGPSDVAAEAFKLFALFVLAGDAGVEGEAGLFADEFSGS